MSKRFTDTEIWNEDWFIVLPNDYKLLWKYIKDTCDHSGIWKPNLKRFEFTTGKVDLDKALEYFNDEDNIRIVRLKNTKFFLPGFFVFQYGEKMNLNNKVHNSVYINYIKNEVDLTSIRGLKEVIQRPKDIDKDKDIEEEDKGGTGEKEKVKFSQYVSMTNEEHSKLVESYGLEFTDKCINALDNYKGSKGKKYKSDYRAILSWVVEKISKQEKPEKKSHIEQRIEENEVLKKMNEQIYGGGIANS
jgi:hypothetical protein